jgi:hypothetical protein
MTFGDTGVPVFNDIAFIDNDVAFGAPRVLDVEVPVAVLTAAPLAVMTFMAVLVFIAFMAFETGATRVQLGTEAPVEALVAALAAPPARFGGVTIETTGGR